MTKCEYGQTTLREDACKTHWRHVEHSLIVYGPWPTGNESTDPLRVITDGHDVQRIPTLASVIVACSFHAWTLFNRDQASVHHADAVSEDVSVSDSSCNRCPLRRLWPLDEILAKVVDRFEAPIGIYLGCPVPATQITGGVPDPGAVSILSEPEQRDE